MKKILSIIFIILCGVLIIPMAMNSSEEPLPVPPPEVVSVESQYAPIIEATKDSENPKLTLSNYMKNWAKENAYPVTQDKSKNVIITKEAEEGFENSPSTILQSSTGFGMATALHILTSTTYQGELKVLFTMTEGHKMIGAQTISPSQIDSDYLINLDNQESKYITNSSAGTNSYAVEKTLSWETPQNNNAFEIIVSGLNGGDSGLDIHKKNANALKFAGNFLANAKSQGVFLELASLNGGLDANTIANDVTFVVVVNDYDARRIQKLFTSSVEEFQKQYSSTEKTATFTINPLELIPEKVLSKTDMNSIVSYLYGVVDGPYSMTSTDLVESSSNIGTAYTFTGNFTSSILVTSFSEEKLNELNIAHNKLFYLSGMTHTMEEESMIWAQKPGSTLLPIMSDYYRNTEDNAISNDPIHHGNECSWLAQKNATTDIISMSVKNPEKYILKFLGD